MTELQNQCHSKSEGVNKMVVNQPNSDFMLKIIAPLQILESSIELRSIKILNFSDISKTFPYIMIMI